MPEGGGGDAVLVDDPFEGGAVAEAVVEGGGWDAAEGEGFVVAEFGLVFAERHLFDAEGPGDFEGIVALTGSFVCPVSATFLSRSTHFETR